MPANNFGSNYKFKLNIAGEIISKIKVILTRKS